MKIVKNDEKVVEYEFWFIKHFSYLNWNFMILKRIFIQIENLNL